MKKEYIDNLINYLNERNKEYDMGRPTISDKEYDDKFFELIKLEKEIGYFSPNSPTQSISYKVVNTLNKVEHNHKMLSLDKTKDYDEVMKFLDDKDFIAMLKLDGLTCSLRYINGRLVSAETRGNGIIGEDILHNAQVIPSIPKFIDYKDELVIDGEVICKHSDFNFLSNDYKNARNFAAGSIRLLDSKECAKRRLTFIAWEVIKGFDEKQTLKEKFAEIKNLGFTIVPFGDLDYIKEWCENGDYPVDGLVFKFNNIAYGQSLGETAHHFKNAIAYKFYDEEYETELLDIEWSMGRTGTLTPIAIFKTIEIDGTEVSKASLHNVSVMREILGNPFVGQRIWVCKKNMIIPQVERAEISNVENKNVLEIPNICPVCNNPVEIIESDSGVLNLDCNNPNCEGKLINRLDHFCGKKGLDIKGLSKATLEKLVDWGWVNNISDIMTLANYRSQWIKKPGFGIASVDKVIKAIEDAKITTLDKFISSLGISLIGQSVSKDLIKHFNTYEAFRKAIDEKYNFSKLDGFADSKTLALWNYDYTEADKVYSFLHIEMPVENNNEENCKDLKFVITGKLKEFKNRDSLKLIIESKGGKVIDSISKNTNYLINNDVNSTSSKNVSAKKLNVPIITEQEFLEKFM